MSANSRDPRPSCRCAEVARRIQHLWTVSVVQVSWLSRSRIGAGRGPDGIRRGNKTLIPITVVALRSQSGVRTFCYLLCRSWNSAEVDS